MSIQTQLKASEISKCLTFSDTIAMTAYNPALNTSAIYPQVTWDTCNDNINSNKPQQMFEYNMKTGQIINVANHLCLTPLPISNSFHVNLDYCDFWRNGNQELTGAGTYLFQVECIDENLIVNATDAANNNNNNDFYGFQQFTFDPIEQSFASNCAHGLKLGITGQEMTSGDSDLDDNIESSNYKAFLTSNSDSFSTAMVATGFNISLTNQVPINQYRTDAVNDILYEILGSNAAQEVVQHGCWCSKISGFRPEFAGQHVDELDRLCKEWSIKRRCNGMVGGSCPSNFGVKVYLGKMVRKKYRGLSSSPHSS